MILCLMLAALYAWVGWELWPREKPATALCASASLIFLGLAGGWV